MIYVVEGLLLIMAGAYILLMVISTSVAILTKNCGNRMDKEIFRDATQALVDLGFDPNDAALRVLEAHKKHPDADVSKIVNVAIRL